MYINSSVYEPNFFCERNRYHSIRETPTCSSGAVSAETDVSIDKKTLVVPTQLRDNITD